MHSGHDTTEPQIDSRTNLIPRPSRSNRRFRTETKDQFKREAGAERTMPANVNPYKSQVNLKETTEKFYESVAASDFGTETSSLSSTYKKRKPAEGFDRLTANKTNYELGAESNQQPYRTRQQDDFEHPMRVVSMPRAACWSE